MVLLGPIAALRVLYSPTLTICVLTGSDSEESGTDDAATEFGQTVQAGQAEYGEDRAIVIGPITGAFVRQRRVRICANKVVAGVRRSSLLLRIRSQDPHQFAAAYPFHQFEGLAVATP